MFLEKLFQSKPVSVNDLLLKLSNRQQKSGIEDKSLVTSELSTSVHPYSEIYRRIIGYPISTETQTSSVSQPMLSNEDIRFWSLVRFMNQIEPEHGGSSLPNLLLLLTHNNELYLVNENHCGCIFLDEIYSVKIDGPLLTSTSVALSDSFSFTVCTLIDKEEMIDFQFVCSTDQERAFWVHMLTSSIWFPEKLRPALFNQPNSIYSIDPSNMILQLPTRRILCIINPFAGKKSALTTFNERAKPIFDNCPGVVMTTILTLRAQHAQDICQQLDLGMWDEICCVGGDGIMHECINGLMRHPDWQRAIKLPICNIPGGSTNAFEVSIIGAQNVALAAFSVARGFTRQMDICSTFQKVRNSETGLYELKREYSFLCLMFGFLANVTHKTDILRKLHITSLRNKIGAFKEMLLKRSYRAKLSFVPFICPEEDRMEFLGKQDLNERDLNYDTTNEKYMLNRHKNQRTNVYNYKELRERTTFESDSTDGPDCPLLHAFFPELFSMVSVVDSQSVLYENFQSDKLIPYGQSNPRVVTIEDDFFGILAVNTSHIASGFPLGMSAYPNSEFIDLMWVLARDKSTTRFSFVKHFFEMEKGDEGEVVLSDHDSVNFERTQVFKLVPEEEGTVVSIDGEEGAFVETFVEVHPGMINYFVL